MAGESKGNSNSSGSGQFNSAAIIRVLSKVNGEENRLIIASAAGLAAVPAYFSAFTFSHLSAVMKTQGAAQIPLFHLTNTSTRQVYCFLKVNEGHSFIRYRRETIKVAIPGSALFFLGMQSANSYWGDSVPGQAAAVFVGQMAATPVMARNEKARELELMRIYDTKYNNWPRDANLTNQIRLDHWTNSKSLYRGSFSYLMTESLSNALGVYFSTSIQKSFPSKYRDNTLYNFMANIGGFAAAAVLASPLSVLNTRYRVTASTPDGHEHASFKSCATQVLKKEGWLVLFAGIKEQALHKGLQQGMLFSLFNWGYGVLKGMKEEEVGPGKRCRI